MLKKKKINKYKNKKRFPPLTVNLHIKASLKNTILTLTKRTGQKIKQWSTKGLKKTTFKKNTPYNIQSIVNRVSSHLYRNRIRFLHIFHKGMGYGRRFVLRNLNKKNLRIKSMKSRTPRPFNGCRQKKIKRR